MGDTRATRTVKETLKTLHGNTSIPWYRVIDDNGTIETEKQKHLLQLEKIPVHTKVILKYKDILFPDFATTYPLKKLRKKTTSSHT